MKKKLFLIAGIVSILNLHGQNIENEVKIGFCIANFINVRWYKDQQFFEQKVNQLGGKVLVRDANNNTENQLSQAIELIDSGVKVLVIIPVDANSAAKIVNVAHTRNVKVIAYDRLILNADLDYYVSFDSYKVGEEMATYVTNKKGNGNYALINGPESDNNSILVKKGAMNILQPLIDQGKINLVCNVNLTEWIELDAYFAVQKCLQDSKDIDVIITAGDILARGALMALNEYDLSGKVMLTGQNADLESVKDIVNGNQTMTIYKSLQTLAENAAELAVKVAKAEKPVDLKSTVNNGKKEVPSMIFNPVVIDVNNIKQTLVKSGHLTEAEIYGN